MKKVIIFSLLSLSCLCSFAQTEKKINESISEYSQKVSITVNDIIKDLMGELKATKDVNTALKNFVRAYQPGSAKFDNAVRAIAKSNILPAILAAGQSSAKDIDCLAPVLDIVEGHTVNFKNNEKINSLLASTKESMIKAIKTNPSMYAQLQSIMNGSSAYDLASVKVIAKLLPNDLNESQRACVDILLHYYSFLAAGGSSSQLSKKDMDTIKSAFTTLAQGNGNSPFGISLDFIMSKMKELFPWFVDFSWLVPSSK